jgi:hypothetical protein
LSDAPSEEWHEPASVTITRMVCQVLVTLIVLAAGLLLVLIRPEYNAGVALVCGVVLGAWFVIPLAFRPAPRRRRKDED